MSAAGSGDGRGAAMEASTSTAADGRGIDLVYNIIIKRRFDYLHTILPLFQTSQLRRLGLTSTMIQTE